jgi:polyisoprenoid-binding protein YceI
MKKLIAGLALTLATSFTQAADYVIDTSGAHASINFKINHLGYSWLTGRFNDFSGNFSYDPAKPEASSINVNIDTTSLDSNHAERDKHLKSGDFLAVDKYPASTFKSTRFETSGEGEMKVYGDLTLHGVTKPVVIDVAKIGEGQDPWGGYRVGFEGTTSIALADYGITYNLGPASTHVDLELHVEGVRQ